MIAPLTNPTTTPANPAPLQDGQIAQPESVVQTSPIAPETTRSAPVTRPVQPDGQVAPTATDPAEPGSPADTVPETPGGSDTIPAPAVSDTSNAGIRARIDSITAEIDELRGQETLTESEQLRLQELTQNRTELFTMLSNLMRQEHEARMAIIRNI